MTNTGKADEIDYLKLTLMANIYDLCHETPLIEATNLSRHHNAKILLKREDLQPIFSFKLRGAYNKLLSLSRESRNNGVIACSAAMGSRKLGIKSKIVMPLNTPSIKVDKVRELGSDVILFGNDFDEAKVKCLELASEEGIEIIHPYDDPYVIAGQGTMGCEILRQIPSLKSDNGKLKAIFCAVGGGGMISGISKYVKSLMPNVLIIGVETHDSNAMTQSLVKNSRILLDRVGLFADGAAES